jgi:hypothetical protein
MLQFGASLTDDTRSVNYNRNTFIIQAKEREVEMMKNVASFMNNPFYWFPGYVAFIVGGNNETTPG